MNAATFALARSELRRRWRALLVLGLIAGLTAGAVTGAAAVARRTGTADERLFAASAPGDAIISSFGRPELGLGSRVAALEPVERAWVAGFGVTQLDADFVAFLGVIAGPPRPDDLFSPVITEGREADPGEPGEVVAFEGFAHAAGVRPGDVLRTKFLTPEEIGMFDVGFGEPDGPRIELRVVGIARTSVPGDSIAPLLATPAFAERYGATVFAGDLVVADLKRGLAGKSDLQAGLDRLSEDVERAEATEEFAAFEPMFPAEAGAEADSTSSALVGGLFTFAAIAALAGLFALWQSFSRHHAVTAGEQEIEAALGLTRRDRALSRVLPSLVAAVVAAVLAASGGVLAGVLQPVGGMRSYEPSPGFAPNLGLAALGAFGAAVAVLVLTTATALLAGRRVASVNRVSTVAERVGAAGGTPPAVVGVRFALEPGRGRTSVPVRSALFGSVVGLAGVAAALTFATSADRLVDDPERWGWDGHFTIADVQPEGVERLLNDERIGDVALVRTAMAPVDGRLLPVYSVENRRGSIDWTLVSGRAPTNDDDIALGGRLADQLGVTTGDVVEIGARDAVQTFEVVGVGMGPSTSGEQMGLNILMTGEAQAAVAVNDAFVEATAEVRPGHDPVAVADEYAQDLEVTSLERPREIENLYQLGFLPELLAVFLALVGLIAVANGVVLAVRRRARDLAVLRTLGFVPRQAALSVVVMAVTMAAIALLVGLPLGVAAGGVVWRSIAEGLYVSTVVAVPALVLVVAVPLALLVSIAVAVAPARRASRLRPANVLRTE